MFWILQLSGQEADRKERFDRDTPGNRVAEKGGKVAQNVGRAGRVAGVGAQVAGKSGEMAGKGMQMAGQGMKAAGQGMQAGGKAVSAMENMAHLGGQPGQPHRTHGLLPGSQGGSHGLGLLHSGNSGAGPDCSLGRAPAFREPLRC